MSLSATKGVASNTVAAGSIDQTVEPFFARIPLIVPAISMLYLRPRGGRIQKQSWGFVNPSGRKEGARTIANRRGCRRHCFLLFFKKSFSGLIGVRTTSQRGPTEKARFYFRAEFSGIKSTWLSSRDSSRFGCGSLAQNGLWARAYAGEASDTACPSMGPQPVRQSGESNGSVTLSPHHGAETAAKASLAILPQY